MTANDTRAAVAALRARGLAVCKPSRGTKSPTYPGWPSGSLEPDDFHEGDLIGLIAGPLSNFNDPALALGIIDNDTMEAVEKADDHLPRTSMVEGRDGKPKDHRYYAVRLASVPVWANSTAPQGSAAAIKFAGHPGFAKRGFNHAGTGKRVIDFCGTGAQCVCPSPGGKRRWVGGDLAGSPAVVTFGELWEATCKLALACGCKAPETVEAGELHAAEPRRLVLSATVETRAVAYLDKMPGAIAGQGGHVATLKAARVLAWGFSLGEEAAFRLLKLHYNWRCRPRWTDAELRHKAHDADVLPYGLPRGWLLHPNRPFVARPAKRRHAVKVLTFSVRGD